MQGTNNLRILDDLNNTPEKLKKGIIIRHAEREKSDVFFPSFNPILTQIGIQNAYLFGIKLREHKQVRLFSSQIERCILTAKEIMKSIGKNVLIEKDSMLGNHGPFVVDPIRTRQKMEKLQEKFIRSWICGEFDSKMILSFEEGTNIFLQWLKSKLNEIETGLDIYISHDIIITPVIATIFQYDVLKKGVIGFLDGFVIFKDDNNNYFIVFEGEKVLI